MLYTFGNSQWCRSPFFTQHIKGEDEKKKKPFENGRKLNDGVHFLFGCLVKGKRQNQSGWMGWKRLFLKKRDSRMFSRQKKEKKKKGGSKKNIQSSKTSQQSFHEAGPRERERKVLELLFTSIPLEKNGRCVSNCWRVRPLPDDSPRTKGRRRKIQQRLCVFLNSASVTIWNAFHQHHRSLENQYLFFSFRGGGVP